MNLEESVDIKERQPTQEVLLEGAVLIHGFIGNTKKSYYRPEYSERKTLKKILGSCPVN